MDDTGFPRGLGAWPGQLDEVVRRVYLLEALVERLETLVGSSRRTLEVATWAGEGHRRYQAAVGVLSAELAAAETALRGALDRERAILGTLPSGVR
ncbi:MAG TPA: hypothetical protein VGC18_15555 [Lacisediminihabitans sp.]|uniref:hypothetical protein n=1 Tax=Lacisediminihabitans sp. TaxID=2787631 RepID=UPI002EDA10C7